MDSCMLPWIDACMGLYIRKKNRLETDTQYATSDNAHAANEAGPRKIRTLFWTHYTPKHFSFDGRKTSRMKATAIEASSRFALSVQQTNATNKCIFKHKQEKRYLCTVQCTFDMHATVKTSGALYKLASNAKCRLKVLTADLHENAAGGV